MLSTPVYNKVPQPHATQFKLLDYTYIYINKISVVNSLIITDLFWQLSSQHNAVHRVVLHRKPSVRNKWDLLKLFIQCIQFSTLCNHGLEMRINAMYIVTNLLEYCSTKRLQKISYNVSKVPWSLSTCHPIYTWCFICLATSRGTGET